MSEIGFGGFDERLSYVDSYVRTRVYVSGGNRMANGSHAVIVGDLHAAVSGRGAGRTVTITLGGSTWTGFRAAAGSAQNTGWLDSSNWITEPGEHDFTISANGSFYFGRSRNGTGDSWTDGYRWSGKIGGGYRNFGAPSAPRNLRIRATGPGSVRADWDHPADDGGSAVHGWRVELATNAAFTENFRVTTEGDSSGFPAGATVYARVAARNAVTDAAGSWSQYSNTTSVTTATTPGVPAAPRVRQPEVEQLLLEWSPPANTGGAPILEYQFRGGVEFTSTETSRLLTGLAPSTQFTFAYRARNVIGWGPWSGDSTATLAGLPTAPRNLDLEQETDTEIRARWDAPTSNGGAPITGYSMRVQNAYSGDTITTVDVGPEDRRASFIGQPSRPYLITVGTRSALTREPVWGSTSRIVLQSDLPGLDGWSAFGIASNSNLVPLVPGGVRRGSVWVLPDSPRGVLFEVATRNTGTVNASVAGLQRVIKGLKVGEQYTFRASATVLDGAPLANRWKLGVVGIGSGSWGATGAAGDTIPLPGYTFEATATEHTVRVYADAATWGGPNTYAATAFSSVHVTEYTNDSPYRLAATVYESSLANHFSRTCASVGGAWWVGRDDVTRFREVAGDDAVAATFTDTRAPGKLEYTDVSTQFDTRNVQNIAHFRNAEIGPDGNTQEVESEIHAVDSVALFGPRRGQVIETNLDIPRYWGNLHPDPNGDKKTPWEWPSQTVEKRDLGGNPTWARLRDTMVETDAIGTRQIWYKHSDNFVNPGERYVFGARVRGEATVKNNSTGQPLPISSTRVRLLVHWKDSTGGTIGVAATPYTLLRTPLNTEPLRTGVLTAPAGAKTVWCYIDLAAQENPVTTVLIRPTYIDVREAQVVRVDAGEEDPGYVDGSTERPQGVTYLWEHPDTKSGRTQVIDESDFWKRADAVLRAGGIWEERVVRIRWNAQENPAVASTLDIQDRVRVERRGVAITDYRILAIRHTVDSGRWMLELDLVPNNLA